MVTFSNEEYADIHFIYGYCDSDAQASGNIDGCFPNTQYQISEFSEMCTRILEKVVNSPNKDVNDHDTMLIW
jgi:hypothetical protein